MLNSVKVIEELLVQGYDGKMYFTIREDAWESPIDQWTTRQIPVDRIMEVRKYFLEDFQRAFIPTQRERLDRLAALLKTLNGGNYPALIEIILVEKRKPDTVVTLYYITSPQGMINK